MWTKSVNIQKIIYFIIISFHRVTVFDSLMQAFFAINLNARYPTSFFVILSIALQYYTHILNLCFNQIHAERLCCITCIVYSVDSIKLRLISEDRVYMPILYSMNSIQNFLSDKRCCKRKILLSYFFKFISFNRSSSQK